MHDLPLIGSVALAGALAVVLPGALALRLLRGRSVTVHVCAVLTLTVLAMIAAIGGVARAMFLSGHDLRVLLVVVSVAGLVSLLAGGWLGRRMATEAMWATEARARERQIEASRRELVAWVSHDLRTPLAGLRAMAEALEDGVVSEPATIADYHHRMRLETDRMTGLVDDLFELSRINAGALRLSLDSVFLGDVVSDAVASAAPVAGARRVRLVAADTGWPVVRASGPELARIVANLLGNAIRYTPADGTVTVTGGQDEQGGWFAVSDTCGGIPEPDLPRVFDVAFRGEAARTPRVAELADDHRDGTGGADGASGGVDGASGGLGLAIVRGLVEAHRGAVAVSNIGGGCRFRVRLPAG